MNDENGFYKDLEEAMKQHGWLLPETIDDVQRAERDLQASTIELPKGLVNPSLVRRNPPDSTWFAAQIPDYTDSMEAL